MPKPAKYPKLRAHAWTTRKGEKRAAYYYDQRGTGKPDIPLGTDFSEALRRWHELAFDRPREAGTIKEALDAWERDALPLYTSKTTRRDYGLCLTQIRPVFGPARWADVTFPTLKAYLKKRSAKTRGNRELSLLSIVWNWARGEGLTELPWPAAGMERSKWKNPENARQFEVTAELFSAVYAHADQLLRDAMDIASATGLRITDARTVAMPNDFVLRGSPSKTGKRGGKEKRFNIDVGDSPIMRALIERRRGYRVAHTMLLSTPSRAVSYGMLDDRWTAARSAAAADPANRAIADQIKAMYLRDMRSRAADLAGSLEDAAELLQHTDKRLTAKHYRTQVKTVKSVR